MATESIRPSWICERAVVIAPQSEPGDRERHEREQRVPDDARRPRADVPGASRSAKIPLRGSATRARKRAATSHRRGMQIVRARRAGSARC